MRSTFRVAWALAIFFLACVGTARADGATLLFYTLTGPVTATFELPTNPTIADGDFDPGAGFYVTPTDLKINGVSSSDFLIFYDPALLGAFADSTDDFSLVGPQLFTGSDQTPTMLPVSGTIPLTDFFTGASYSLTVEPVPEPASLLLFTSGLLALAMKRTSSFRN
jgi:hypothetical protein